MVPLSTAAPPCGLYSGTVFKLDPAGNESVLYTFSGGADGDGPQGGLLLDKEGNVCAPLSSVIHL